MPTKVITASFVSSSFFASAHAHAQVHVTDEDCNPLHVFSAFPGPVRFLKLTAGSASSGSGNSGSGSSEDSGPCLVALGSQDDGSTTLSSAGSSSSGGGGGGSSALWALKIWKLSSLLASLPPASTSAEVGDWLNEIH